jgi:outer membrane receptor protein involved in Fe transport
MNKARLAIVAWGVLLFCPPAFAQEEGEDELEVDLFFAPAESVVSAARRVQPLERSPSAVTVLTREDIEASGARVLAEVLRLVPSMDIYTVQPRWNVVGIRGATYMNSDTMLLLVDGRDVTIELLGVPVWSYQHFSMDDVDRIEVIRGPGSALYGANAYAGVVNVITREPGEGPSVSASARGGEFGFVELSGRGTHKIGPVAVSAAAGLVRHDLYTGRDIQAAEQNRARITSKIDLGEDIRLLVDSGFFHASGTFPIDVGESALDSAYNFYAHTRLEHKDLSFQAVYDWFDFDGSFGLGLYYPDLGLDLADVPPVLANANKVALSVQHNLEVFHNHLTYGAEYIFNHYYANIFWDSDLDKPDTDHNEHRFGMFVHDELDLSGLLGELTEADVPPLYLTAGLRFDYNSVTDYELSPRAAVVFIPAENHSIRVGYAHAFLKPTFFESSLDVRLIDISSLGIDSMDLSAPDLKNETIDSLELGYGSGFFGGRLRLRVSLAYNWYRDTIGFAVVPAEMNYLPGGIPDLNGPGFGYINDPVGEDGYNAELEIIARPTERSRLFALVSYRDIFNADTGDSDPLEPAWQMALGADLSGASGWTASLRAFFTDEYLSGFRGPEGVLVDEVYVKVPASWFLNARIAWTLVGEPTLLKAGVEAFNLLNFRYRQYGGLDMVNRFDFWAETVGRRITLFVQGEI